MARVGDGHDVVFSGTSIGSVRGEVGKAIILACEGDDTVIATSGFIDETCVLSLDLVRI